MTTVVAVDLGASSGRVLRGVYEAGALTVEECARFDNGPVEVRGELYWDILALWRGVLHGLDEASRRGPIDSVGIDTWAVDYALLDADGLMLGNPASYRSGRTAAAVEALREEITPSELYRRTGLQHQPFNTLFQLIADQDNAPTALAQIAVLLPDLLGYWLTGSLACEVTNASTTGLMNPKARDWDPELLALLRERFGVTVQFPSLVEPGTIVGTAACIGAPLVAVGSHDTASAVVGVPATGKNFGFVSSGTWSLVGLELDHPIRTAESRAANFTNELGVCGTVRYLKNIMGMWVQQECLRQWQAGGARDLSWPTLDAETEAAEPLRTLLDMSDTEFMAPGNMLARIDTWARAHGEPVPRSRGEYLRALTESLAVAYRRALREASQLSGQKLTTVHIVGGGSKNALLCQLTADATGLPVVAGPTEGTALGNMVVQLHAIGALDGGLSQMRRVVAASATTTLYQPTPGATALWDAAENRVFTNKGESR